MLGNSFYLKKNTFIRHLQFDNYTLFTIVKDFDSLRYFETTVNYIRYHEFRK